MNFQLNNSSHGHILSCAIKRANESKIMHKIEIISPFKALHNINFCGRTPISLNKRS